MALTFEGLSTAATLAKRRPLHLAIGMFDGVHLGHQAVIRFAVQAAQRSGGVSAVLTFDPHPSRLFRPDDPVKMILDRDRRVNALSALGVDAVIVQTFDRDYAGTQASEFLPHLRSSLPGLHTVYVGENWRFGRGREGDVDFLITEARKLGLHVVSAPRINADGEPISSTRIRGLLGEGKIRAANVLLGRAYASDGLVEPGKRIGRTIGFPTLNLSWVPDLRPRFGVYVVSIESLDVAAPGRKRAGVANYGLRPTVEKGVEPLLEVHVLGIECPFETGSRVRVEWLDFLRGERRFENLEALRLQIGRDREQAETWFAKAPSV
jgi:riboflavin kinase/FMN adenylyltransferase